MKYLVIARKYRPQRFSDVVGQEAILSTLRNALASDKAAHAYLFSGPRGVGKTTLARLFAKAINCHSPAKDFEPCNQCPSCAEILSGQSLDVIEIDGASNRGIDDIRQLNETVGYAPSGKYKIYLIDEVHMLTKEAFNALLKTLEEPPPRAKFFFATTEPHKVLPTILSRCQRFDLRRITSEEIAQKLLFIAQDLQRQITPEAATLIAEFAEGSLRDAESLFDQILCYADAKVEQRHVQEVLGLVPQELFFSLDEAFQEDRTSFAFEIVEQIFRMGKDLNHFAEQLIQHYRRLALIKLTSSPAPTRLETSARIYTQQQLLHILDLLLNSYASLQKSPMQRVHLESMLLNILRSRQRIPVEVLVRRLSELEQKLTEKKTELSKPEIAPEIKAVQEPPKPALATPEVKQVAPQLTSVQIEPPKPTLATPEVKQVAPPIVQAEPSIPTLATPQLTALQEDKPLQELRAVPFNLQASVQQPTHATPPAPKQASWGAGALKATPILSQTLQFDEPPIPSLSQASQIAEPTLILPSEIAEEDPFSRFAPIDFDRLLAAKEIADCKEPPPPPKQAAWGGGEVKATVAAPKPNPAQTTGTDYETLLRFAAVELEGSLKL